MVTEIWVNIGSDNGLVPNGTKTLPEPISTVRSSDIHLRAISQEITQKSMTEIILKITHLKFHQKFKTSQWSMS